MITASSIWRSLRRPIIRTWNRKSLTGYGRPNVRCPPIAATNDLFRSLSSGSGNPAMSNECRAEMLETLPNKRGAGCWKAHGASLMILGLLMGCGQHREPASPPSLSFGGLPISGNLADAKRAGFTDCIANDTDMSCRRSNVSFVGKGPFYATVEFDKSDGSGSFNQLTLWHATNEEAVYEIASELKRQSWRECFIGGRWGYQVIYTRSGSPVFISMDLRYWLHRQFRVIPAWKRQVSRC